MNPVNSRMAAFYAKGRLKHGEMNKTEAEYGAMLELRKRAGEILWYRFESIKLRLADSAFYTVDFFVMRSDMTLEAHEVKGGFITEGGNLRVKFAAEQFPIFRFVIAQKRAKKDGGGFEIREVG